MMQQRIARETVKACKKAYVLLDELVKDDGLLKGWKKGMLSMFSYKS